MKIKKGDNVIVVAGKDKGKKGKVLKVIKETNKIIVEGVQISKIHKKPTRGQKGAIIESARPINASNVMIIDGGKASRVGYKMVAGKKIRIAKKTGVEI
jgi:large subunit ribosomal protein L24